MVAPRLANPGWRLAAPATRVEDQQLCFGLWHENNMKKYIIFLFLAVAPLVSGCSHPYDWVECPDEVSVTVQMADQPVFSWDPACSADKFVVQALSPSALNPSVFFGHNVWRLETRNDAPVLNPTIFPPLTYSVKPDDVDQPTPAIPLERGGRYRVLVTAYLQEHHRYEVVGRAEFIYAP